MTTDSILKEVARERTRQTQKWSGIFDDRLYDALDWHEMIADYNAWARRMLVMRNHVKARRRYVQIAALAVAAIEALDAKNLDAICAGMANNIFGANRGE